MKRGEFIKGQKYTHEQYMELSILEMMESKSEHTDRADPKVGAVLVDKKGAYFDKAARRQLNLLFENGLAKKDGLYYVISE